MVKTRQIMLLILRITLCFSLYGIFILVFYADGNDLPPGNWVYVAISTLQIILLICGVISVTNNVYNGNG